MTGQDTFEQAVAVREQSGLVRRPHTARRFVAVVILLALAFTIYTLAKNKAMQWSVVGHYFGSSAVLHGLFLTVWLTALVTVLGFALGIVLAVMRLADNPVMKTVSWVYVWLFRSTPLLVQLIFWFNIGYLFPAVSFGIPFGPTFVSVESRNLISATVAAILGLTLHTAAYASEVIRGGILSVDPGQREAAHALALGPVTVFFRIVLPQAMKSIIPPAGNLFIDTLKSTSLVSVIAVSDLLYSVQLIYNNNFEIIPLLLVATIWYIVVTSVLSVGQYYVERRFARGARRALPPTPLQRLRGRLAAIEARSRKAIG
jgi:polar amino acid transport system permease protein